MSVALSRVCVPLVATLPSCRADRATSCDKCARRLLTFLQLVQILLLVVRRDALEEVDVVGGVEPLQLLLTGGVGPVHLHTLVHAVGEEEGVGHAKAVGLHWVAGHVVVRAEAA